MTLIDIRTDGVDSIMTCHECGIECRIEREERHPLNYFEHEDTCSCHPVMIAYRKWSERAEKACESAYERNR
jgi:hypothetical protein